MSVKIRLTRGGSKKRPYYRIVVADSRSPRDGRFIQRVGSYNPMLPKDHDERVIVNADLVNEWMGKGAKPTDRVARLLAQKGVIAAPERREQTKAHMPSQRTLERRQEKEEKLAAAAEAAAEAASE